LKWQKNNPTTRNLEGRWTKKIRFRWITITRRLKGHYWIVGKTGEHCTAVMMYEERFALQESNKEMYFAT
jgi:hypothetical protein